LNQVQADGQHVEDLMSVRTRLRARRNWRGGDVAQRPAAAALRQDKVAAESRGMYHTL
jgi:hypothetical protein